MSLPIEVVAPVVAAMAMAIAALWNWGRNRSRKVDELQDLLLEEKEAKLRILTELRAKAEEKLRRRLP